MTPQEARDVKASRVCACGKPKGVSDAFCYYCYMRLSREEQTALWSKVGQGFETAYQQVLCKLRHLRQIK